MLRFEHSILSNSQIRIVISKGFFCPVIRPQFSSIASNVEIRGDHYTEEEGWVNDDAEEEVSMDHKAHTQNLSVRFFPPSYIRWSGMPGRSGCPLYRNLKVRPWRPTGRRWVKVDRLQVADGEVILPCSDWHWGKYLARKFVCVFMSAQHRWVWMYGGVDAPV